MKNISDADLARKIERLSETLDAALMADLTAYPCSTKIGQIEGDKLHVGWGPGATPVLRCAIESNGRLSRLVLLDVVAAQHLRAQLDSRLATREQPLTAQDAFFREPIREDLDNLLVRVSEIQASHGDRLDRLEAARDEANIRMAAANGAIDDPRVTPETMRAAAEGMTAEADQKLIREAVAYLREEADFNRSFTDGRRGAPFTSSDQYKARHLELASERDAWASAIERRLISGVVVEDGDA